MPRTSLAFGIAAAGLLGLGVASALTLGGGTLADDGRRDDPAAAPRLAHAMGMLLCGSASARTPEQAFLAANTVAMMRMMAAMETRPSGDIDADFVNMMEPHHQGAIDMAMLQLRYGKNPQLRRLAQEIIVDQRQEIDAMRLALGRPLQPSTAVPTQLMEKQP